ncbi:hypothetical protein EPN81_02460 [Patescibacteria group bacterium]|nr:MAG: hypothetical protein EPN81_02460 [Patescibacteria group bacterium]
MSLFDVGHVAKLHEIQTARLRAGQEGIGAQVDELIRRLELGGVNQWRIHAKRLWDRGFGRDPVVNAKNFKTYLQGIPQIPAGLLADDADLSLLSLADPRPGLLRSCKLLGVLYEELGYSEGDAVPFDERFAIPVTPFWFRHDDGRKNRERRPDHCREEPTNDILVGTAMEGIFAYAHHPHIVVQGEHIIDLPGTVPRGLRVSCAYLGVWGGQTGLDLSRHSGIPGPGCGSLCVRRK